jgi:hypothetical protein
VVEGQKDLQAAAEWVAGFWEGEGSGVHDVTEDPPPWLDLKPAPGTASGRGWRGPRRSGFVPSTKRSAT